MDRSRKDTKYAEATKNNSIFQNKLYETYNILGRQKLLIQYSLSISAKSKAVPSKLRKEIKQLQKESENSYKNILEYLNSDETTIVNEEIVKNFEKSWEDYFLTLNKITKTLGRAISLRGGTRVRRGEDKNKINPASELLAKWITVSNNLSDKVAIMAESSTFRPERLVKDIEDLQDLGNEILLYSESSVRIQTMLVGIIAADDPISLSELKIINSLDNKTENSRKEIIKYFEMLRNHLASQKEMSLSRSDLYKLLSQLDSGLWLPENRLGKKYTATKENGSEVY